MEAEARDSDEETERDFSVKQLAQRSPKGVNASLPRTMPMPTVPKPSSPAGGTLTIRKEVIAPVKMACHTFDDILMANQLLSTPCKDSISVRASEINCKALGEFNIQNNMGGNHHSMKETSHHETPVNNLCKQSNTFTPDTSSKISSHSDAAESKFCSLGYSRKKPRTSVSTEDELVRISSCHENLQLNDVPMPAPKQDAGNFPFVAVRSPAAFAYLHHMEEPCSASPLKRKVAVPSFDSISPESGFANLKPSAPENSLVASTSAQFECPLNNGTLQGKLGCPTSDGKNPSCMSVLASPMADQDRSSSKSDSTAYKKNVLRHNSALRVNNAPHFSSGQVADPFCNAVSMWPQDGQRSTSELPSAGTRDSDGTLFPTGCKWINLDKDHNPEELTNSKMSVNNNVKDLCTLSTDGKHADGMPPKCETLEASPHKESDQSLQPGKGDLLASELSNIPSGARKTEKPMAEIPSYCGHKDSGMRMLPNTANSGIHHNSCAKNLSKKAIARKKLGCKLKSTAASNNKGNAYSNKSVTPNEPTLERAKVKGTDLEQKDSQSNDEMIVTVSKDAVTEDHVRGHNSPCKSNNMSVGTDGAPHLSEKFISMESSSRLEKVKESIFTKTVDDRKNEMVKSLSVDTGTGEKVKNAHKHVNKNSSKNVARTVTQMSNDAEKENKPANVLALAKSYENGGLNMTIKYGGKSGQGNKIIDETTGDKQQSHQHRKVISEPAWFILCGHRLQRKEFRMIIRHLRGRLCNDSHHWSYKATHFIVPEPVRRTEKFFAATASGRWILGTDYLTASNEAGKFLEEETFEWHGSGFTKDGAINLEAPRRWRLLRERTGHGAFYGMRIIIYGESIVPPKDTLKRVVKAGDGTILATCPPYTRFLKSGIDFAVISPVMPHADTWIQEFLRHEVPCILADYLVEYVCKPGLPLGKHVLYETHAWAEKSFANLLRRSEEIITADESRTSSEGPDDLSCSVCGSCDRGEVMLICGDEGGFRGCGIGTHIDCCNPPLDAVPEEDWFCPKCAQSRVRKTPVKGKRKR